MTDQNDARETADDIAAALGHLGWQSVEDLHDWAKGNDIDRFDQLVQTLARHRIASAATARGEADELRRENERLSKAIMGGILPGLLNEDETDALVDLVKSLRSPARAR